MCMKKLELWEIIQANVKYFMARDDAIYKNANALAEAARGKISPNTIRHIIDPDKRTVTDKKKRGYPGVDKLAVLAGLLPKCEAWMLIHPDIKKALSALAMYDEMLKQFAQNEVEEPQQPRGSENEIKGLRTQSGSHVSPVRRHPAR